MDGSGNLIEGFRAILAEHGQALIFSGENFKATFRQVSDPEDFDEFNRNSDVAQFEITLVRSDLSTLPKTGNELTSATGKRYRVMKPTNDEPGSPFLGLLVQRYD